MDPARGAIAGVGEPKEVKRLRYLSGGATSRMCFGSSFRKHFCDQDHQGYCMTNETHFPTSPCGLLRSSPGAPDANIQEMGLAGLAMPQVKKCSKEMKFPLNRCPPRFATTREALVRRAAAPSQSSKNPKSPETRPLHHRPWGLRPHGRTTIARGLSPHRQGNFFRAVASETETKRHL